MDGNRWWLCSKAQYSCMLLTGLLCAKFMCDLILVSACFVIQVHEILGHNSEEATAQEPIVAASLEQAFTIPSSLMSGDVEAAINTDVRGYEQCSI